MVHSPEPLTQMSLRWKNAAWLTFVNWENVD